MFPPKLKPGDTIRVIAPSGTKNQEWITDELVRVAIHRLEDLGFSVEFAEHVDEAHIFGTASIESRVTDLHEAFKDSSVNGILTVIGGHNVNQILREVDYTIISQNPKVLCGYSDITALQNAILAKTGLVTYSGPHFTTFFEQSSPEYMLRGFQQCVMQEGAFEITPAEFFHSSYYAPKTRLSTNEGWWIIQSGESKGTIVGGNLCTFNLLQGTEFMPSIEGSILFLEDDLESNVNTFDRDLQSLIHLPGFEGVRGMVIGRFQEQSKVSHEALVHIITSKKELANIPVIANVDFGHTNPICTFPIGGKVQIKANGDKPSITILEH